MRLEFLNRIFDKGFNLSTFILLQIPRYIDFILIKHDRIELIIKQIHLYSVSNFFKTNSSLLFKTIVDIAVIDFPSKLKRFKLNYNFLSYEFSTRLTLSLFIKEADFAPSLKKIYPVVDWMEREIWDMYGVFFVNHFDLRRILTDYGFAGFPLKKDFPLTGYIELRYDDTKGDVVYEPLELAQELRFFNFSSGWEYDH